MDNEQRTRTKVVKEMDDCYFRADEVAKYLSIGLSTVWVKSKNDDDEFPSPKSISSRISVWKKSDLDNWVNRNTAEVTE
jgi:predicted DNA-binding transcriptional regulator AlpA|tara:strand:+ start:872 stop:1108 length:237 start_codon:yes stop_codon:yes gene_type:complete